ncbi:MAG: hypothetical protein ACXW2A_05580 [Burkholderiales bacterium]
MENTRKFPQLGTAQNPLHVLHDRLTSLMARTNFEAISLHIIGAMVLLEIIFSLHSNW